MLLLPLDIITGRSLLGFNDLGNTENVTLLFNICTFNSSFLFLQQTSIEFPQLSS